MPRYFDSHCHLPKTEPFSLVFARANASGIVGCVLNAVTMDDWDEIIQIDATNVRGAVGVHPWAADNASPDFADKLDKIMRDNPKLLVGEIGLDKTHNDFKTQEEIFVAQLEIAIKYNRTVILHCVHAWDEMLKILKSYKKDLPKIVVHSFDGTQNALDFGGDLYFSYSPNVANPQYKKVRTSVTNVSKNKILVESDSAEILPTIAATNGVLSLRNDVSADDIFNNAIGVFFNG